MTYTFHWEVPLQNLPQFLWGALATLELSGVACLLGLIVAVAGALARLSKNKYLRWTATAYVEVIRNTPFIVQLFYVYFGIVAIGINLEAFSVAIITLTLNCGAYCTEIIRSGIQGSDFIGFTIPDGEDDDRGLAPLAELPAHLEAVDVREADVEHDQGHAPRPHRFHFGRRQFEHAIRHPIILVFVD